MKYFIDTEFLEGTQKKTILGISYGNTKPTIDLISIGIVAEDGREYYAVSKDFNLKEAWNRWQQRTGEGDRNNIEPRLYWIRENVLKLIFNEWKQEINGKIVRLGLPLPLNEMKFSYKNFKYCIKCIGKTNKQIAEEVKEFIYKGSECNNNISNWGKEIKYEFYGYYSDYDWVVFCWLFGKMNELPNGFPYYCIDLKQELDSWINRQPKGNYTHESLKKHLNYPKQINEHNALSDAKWNKELYEFLKKI